MHDHRCRRVVMYVNVPDFHEFVHEAKLINVITAAVPEGVLLIGRKHFQVLVAPKHGA
jgi:hypothetical protein